MGCCQKKKLGWAKIFETRTHSIGEGGLSSFMLKIVRSVGPKSIMDWLLLSKEISHHPPSIGDICGIPIGEGGYDLFLFGYRWL